MVFFFIFEIQFEYAGKTPCNSALEGLFWIVYFFLFLQHYIYASLLILRTSQYTVVIKIEHLTIVFSDEAVLLIDCK